MALIRLAGRVSFRKREAREVTSKLRRRTRLTTTAGQLQHFTCWRRAVGHVRTTTSSATTGLLQGGKWGSRRLLATERRESRRLPPIQPNREEGKAHWCGHPATHRAQHCAIHHSGEMHKKRWLGVRQSFVNETPIPQWRVLPQTTILRRKRLGSTPATAAQRAQQGRQLMAPTHAGAAEKYRTINNHKSHAARGRLRISPPAINWHATAMKPTKKNERSDEVLVVRSTYIQTYIRSTTTFIHTMNQAEE